MTRWSRESQYKEWKTSEFPNALQLRDAEANRLRKQGWKVITYVWINVDLPKPRVIYCLLATKRHKIKEVED